MTSTVLPPRATTPPGTPLLPAWARAASDTVDLADLAERVVAADVGAAFGSLRDDAEFLDRLRASVTENLHHLRRVIGGRALTAEVELVEPFALAALQARLRLPQTALQRSYRVGFQTMLDEWTARLLERAEVDDVPRAEALGALRDLTTLLLDYQHHVASRVADSFARTDEAMSRSREHVRNGLVRQLLRGDLAAPPPSDLVLLDYPLQASHLAVLLPTTAQGTARRVATALRAACHARDTLVHPVDLTSTVIWLAMPRPGWRPAAVADLGEALRSVGVEASLSDAHQGLEGFRRSWQQTQDVQRVRSAWRAGTGPRVLSHTDVSLEILLMTDPARARAFVAAELGGLGGDDELSARLRETVETSLRCGTHVTTAEAMHLHEHTVRNRLQKAAELLGRPLTERRTELQVALRLSHLLAQDTP